MSHNERLRRRLVWSAGLSAAVVVGATLLVPSHAQPAQQPDALQQRYAAERATTLQASPRPAGAPLSPDGHDHVHDDPTTKNAVSREPASDETRDPTTPARAAVGAAAVAAQRAEPDPRLVPLAAQPRRADVPQDRYAMASGCYALQSARTGRWVRRTASGYAATAGGTATATPFHFRATDLGKYLLFGDQRDFVSRNALTGSAESRSAPSPAADWTVARSGPGFRFTVGGRSLVVGAAGRLTTAAQPEAFRLRRTTGCASWPEVQTNISGRTFRGVSAIQEVRGTVDAHTHGMAFEFLGGEVHCGRPWHPYGVTYALRDCEDHYIAGGRGAVLEDVLNSGTPGTGHDPVGWPTFEDWPAPRSLTHEGTYDKWMERAWRGGMRVFVNLLVENGKLCQVYPLKRNSCDDMDSIRLQAKDMRLFERYVDAQFGGPGKGWYRIVTDPFQARRVVNQGKLAVVMGVETSVLFGCTQKADVPDPSCTKASIDRQLDELKTLGVSQMELVNKFDNALSGVAGDTGETGVAVNSANFLETGSFWDMRRCPTTYPTGVQDRDQVAAPDPNPFDERDALFGAIQDQYGVTPPLALPLYGTTPHCNRRGLTELGAHTITGMVGRDMLVDPDHMSVSGRKAALSLLEALRYPGVVSSHSWSTPDAYPRIYRLGGFVAPYAGDSTGFVAKWKQHLSWADPRYYFGFGYGADMNGLGAQGDPRGAGASNPVTYPFTGMGGVTVHQQRSGQRVYDVNKDGVAHYGLYPDWLQDLRKVAGSQGAAITTDMARGAEAYLQTWERAHGVRNDGCRDSRALRSASSIRALVKGSTADTVLRRIGQPHTRLDRTFGYCATGSNGSTVRLRVEFDRAGRLTRVV